MVEHFVKNFKSLSLLDEHLCSILFHLVGFLSQLRREEQALGFVRTSPRRREVMSLLMAEPDVGQLLQLCHMKEEKNKTELKHFVLPSVPDAPPYLFHQIQSVDCCSTL